MKAQGARAVVVFKGIYLVELSHMHGGCLVSPFRIRPFDPMLVLNYAGNLYNRSILTHSPMRKTTNV